MTIYQQPLWGYELELSEGWIHQTIQDTEGFAMIPEALQPGYEGRDLGHLLIRGEWNWSRQPLEPLWNQHVTRLSVMLGAKKLGSAPWTLRNGSGFEAEILLPKKTNKRLWIGLLAFDAIILHFMVTHWKEGRSWFEPFATQIIRSLHFVENVQNIPTNTAGCPIPPGYQLADPKDFLSDLTDASAWEAYAGQANVGALQAFYLRELPFHGWEIETFVPHPNRDEIDFARLQIGKGQRKATLGILPLSTDGTTSAIVIRQITTHQKD